MQPSEKTSHLSKSLFSAPECTSGALYARVPKASRVVGLLGLRRKSVSAEFSTQLPKSHSLMSNLLSISRFSVLMSRWNTFAWWTETMAG